MLFFCFLIIIGIIILSNLHTKQIIQQCDCLISQIFDENKNVQHPEKIHECVSFLKKHSVRINKLIQTNNEFKKKLKDFDYDLDLFVRNTIYEKRNSLYTQQLSILLTHTIKDRDLKKQIVTAIKNSKYIPQIANNEEEHFTYNLLNHYVHKGNPVDWEYIEIEYPDVFKNINSLCLKYLTDNKYTTDLMLSELHRIGEGFAKKDDFFKIVTDIVDSIYAENIDLMKILTYLQNKKFVKPEKADEYKKQYNNCVKMLEINRKKIIESEQKRDDTALKKNDELWKKYHEIKRYILSEYVCTIVKNGDLDEYIKLSEKLGRLLFRVDAPGSKKYIDRSNYDWLEAHKKILNARVYGINILLLFGSKDFENDSYDTEYYSQYSKEVIKTTVSADYVLKFKQEIDKVLSEYYPVPNFLTHAKEILDAYITGKTFCKQMHSHDGKIAGWHDNYGRKLCDIQLSSLSPYESFGFSTGYLESSLDLKKRIYIQYDYILRSIKDIAFKAYLKSMDDEIFDKAYEYCWEQIKNIEKQNS